MPRGKGTYGSKVGRPAKKKKMGVATNKIPIVCQTHKINDKVAKHLVTMDVTTFLKITEPIRKEEMRIKASLDSSLDISL